MLFDDCVCVCSEAVTGDDGVDAGPADRLHASAAVDAATHNCNTSSMPSYQYDSSGMTELSLATDEVCFRVMSYQSVNVKLST